MPPKLPSARARPTPSVRCADTDLTPHPTAAEGLADDEAALSADKQALSFLDSLLGKEKAVELSEEVSVRKLQDQVLESMQKGDKAEVARLEAKVREAQAAAKAEEAKIAMLQAEEAKEVISTRECVRPYTCTPQYAVRFLRRPRRRRCSLRG